MFQTLSLLVLMDPSMGEFVANALKTLKCQLHWNKELVFELNFSYILSVRTKQVIVPG